MAAPLTITDLVNFDTIRAVLTVSESDLPDEILSKYGLEDDLLINLNASYPTWNTVQDDLIQAKLRMYSKYRVAAWIATTAPLFVLIMEGDGNNQARRSDKDGFRWLSESLAARAVAIMTELQDDAGMTQPTIQSIISGVPPLRNVITTPRA